MSMLLALTLALSPASPPAAAAEPQHPRVVIIGVDGVSLNLLEPYTAAGVTPVMGTLMKEGARGHFASFWPMRTPSVWTSVATGKLPGQHGIWDHLSDTYYNPPGIRTKEKRIVTSRDRRSKALWSLLDANGVRTLVVGWPRSWPAERLQHGVMVAPIELMGDKRQTTIKGSFFRDADDMVQPESLTGRMRELMVEPKEIEAAEVARFADVPPAGHPLYAAVPWLSRYMYTFEWSVARARSVEALTVGMVPEVKPDLVMAYFQCTDTILHRFWIFKEPVTEIEERLAGHGISPSSAAELKKRFGGAVEACYRDVDERIGRMLAAIRGPDTIVLVISDHGFGHPVKPHRLKDEPYGGVHLDEGVIIAAGPGVAAGKWVEGGSVLDVTPTVLHLFGQPVAGDMRGKVIEGLFASGPGAAPVKRIPTYEAAPQLEAPFAEGWPVRKGPLTPTAAQMPAATSAR